MDERSTLTASSHKNEIMTDVIRHDTVVIGSGAAAYNAVDWLYDLGRTQCLGNRGPHDGHFEKHRV